MVGVWKGFLLDRIAEWGLPVGGDWTFVVRNNYQPHGSYLNVMWFHNGGAFPCVVVKCCDDPAPLKMEFQNLQRVHELAPAFAPRPLHFGPLGRLCGLWMEGLPGAGLSTAKCCDPDVLPRLAEVVASLHTAVRRSPKEGQPGRYRRLLQDPLEALAQFGNSSTVIAGCSQIAADVSAERLNSLPVIPQHGDLYCGNMLSHKGRFYIVDWESFGAIDLPFYDLLTLLYALFRDTGPTLETSDPRLISLAPGLIRSYAHKLGLRPEDVTWLLPLALANWFYLHLRDAHKAFTEEMYRTILQYFEDPESVKRVFLS